MKKFKSSFNVYYEDTDAGGVVYYANYLKFIERARTDAMASVGFTNSNLRANYGIYIIWLIGVILWNFGYPEAAPILDVLAAIILSLLSFGLKKYLN